MNWNELRGILKRPIAFHPIFSRIGGGAKAGIFLSQMLYWDERTDDPDGWFYKTQAEWEQETALNDEEQLTVRRQLIKRNLIEEEKRGIPAQLFYRLMRDNVLAAIEQEVNMQAWGGSGNKNPGNPETVIRETRKQGNGKGGDKVPGNPETLIGTESTTESTQRNGQLNSSDNSVEHQVWMSLSPHERTAVEREGKDWRKYVLTYHPDKVAACRRQRGAT